MQKHPEHIVYSGEVIEFVKSCNDFCMLVEKAGSMSKTELLGELHRILPGLYAQVAGLPETEPVMDEFPDKYVREVDWENIRQGIMKKLAHHNFYLEVFDERMQESERPVTASIAENLADIYQDLKNFVKSYSYGITEIMNDSLWECMMNFRNYWGQKLLNVMRAIHALYYGQENPDEESEEGHHEENPGKNGPSNWLLTKMQQQYKEKP